MREVGESEEGRVAGEREGMEGQEKERMKYEGE